MYYHPLKEKKWQIGDRLLLSVDKWDPYYPKCKFKRFLGSIDDASIDTDIVIQEHQVRAEFPKQVLNEAHKVAQYDMKSNRKDLTHLECITIDPVDAKDYDDAFSLTQDKKGNYHLGVHIADVSYFVTPGSQLDKEAYKRGNSTYFLDKVVPMLPSELSNDICSLKEGVERCCMSVLMTFSDTGKLKSYSIERTRIKSRKRFTYEEAFAIIQGKQKSPYSPLILRAIDLFKHLQKQKMDRGSIPLFLPEVRLNLDNEGQPMQVEEIEYDISHQLIEEFMVKTNEVIAKHLDEKKKMGVYRIHERPDDRDTQEFYDFLRQMGYTVPQKPTPQELQKIFESARHSPQYEQMCVKYIRSMKLAVYSSDNAGHFGLLLDNYTHFTSPIRRYADLVVHRLILEKPRKKLDLEGIVRHVSDTERKSFKAEMALLEIKKLRYLYDLFCTDPYAVYEAVITTVKSQGIVFQLQKIRYEGFISVSNLGHSGLRYDPDRNTLTAPRSGKVFMLGQKMQVELESIDLVYQECEWLLSLKSKKRDS